VFGLTLTGKAGNRILFSQPRKTDASTGAITATFPAPKLASSDDRQEMLGISATDQTRSNAGATTEEESAFTLSSLSAFNVDVDSWDSGSVRPGKLSRVHAYGFGALGDRPFTSGALYVHYVRGKKLVKTSKVGVLRGPCGVLETKLRQFPFKALPGKYMVDFDLEKTYDPKAPGIRYRKVRVPRSNSARSAASLSVQGPARR
jgi:hypothetical protein